MSACRGDCTQGRRECPCPQACELPDVWDRPINWQKLAIFCAALLVILWAIVLH